MKSCHTDQRMASSKIADETDRKAGSSSRTLPLSGEGRLPRISGQAGRGQQDKSDKVGHPNRRNYFRTVHAPSGVRIYFSPIGQFGTR